VDAVTSQMNHLSVIAVPKLDEAYSSLDEGSSSVHPPKLDRDDLDDCDRCFSSMADPFKIAAFVASMITRRLWVMRCRSVPLLIISIGLLAGGCAGVQGVTSNDTGGIIPWTPETQQMAYSIASERCAQYDKYARITSVNARPGNYIGFTCVWSPHARP
jgi:hypothetical protein